MTDLPFAPACERNKGPILAELKHILPERGRVLEIASGTGQHAVHFAPAFPNLTWQSSERRTELPGLAARLESEGRGLLPPPLELDVLEKDWPTGPFQAAFSANSAHIMPWEAVCAMLDGVGRVLEPGARFSLYGPFNVAGRFTSQSNRDFDRQLKMRDASMGLRDVSDMEDRGRRHGLALSRRIDMPANNFLLVFTRQTGPGDRK